MHNDDSITRQGSRRGRRGGGEKQTAEGVRGGGEVREGSRLMGSRHRNGSGDMEGDVLAARRQGGRRAGHPGPGGRH
jgi:hypothetical protein